MKPITAIAVVVLAAAPLATPGRSADRVEPARRTQDNTALGQVRQLEERLREAALKGDVSFFEEYWADGYLRTNSFGILLSREEALSNYRNGALKYQRLEFDDERVQVYGDTAVVTARVKVKGRFEKEELDGTFRHTRVWTKLPQGWRVIVYHASRVEDEDSKD